MSLLKSLTIICIGVVVNGCAANMALSKGQNTIDVSKKSIALLSVKISNKVKSEYQPSLTYAHFFAVSDGAEKEMIDIKEDPHSSLPNQYNEYLLSFYLKPGTYSFAAMGCWYRSFLVTASCLIPLNLKVDIKPNSISYLGNIDAVIRPKTNDSEYRAGMLVPVIDQAIVGFSTATFDVVITDKLDDDMKAFLSDYPALRNAKVEKTILPMWTRPEHIDEKK